MTTLSFTDPRVVAAYIDRFEDRSIAPIVPYLWENADSDTPIINKVRREELDMMVIDEGKDKILVDAAVYTDHQNNEQVTNVLLLSHEQIPGSENYWDLRPLAILRNKIEADNLIKQIAGQASIAFSVVE